MSRDQENRRESAAYSAFFLGHSLRGCLGDPFWLILFSFLIPGLTSLGPGAPVPVFLLAPVLSLLAYLIQRLMGLQLHAEPANVLVMIPLLLVVFFALGIGEEAGWTGYATDPMQSRWSALTTASIVGLVTSLWHLVPLVKMGHSALWITWWAAWSVPLRILILWVYNNTGRSLFAAIVMHAMINLSSSSPFIPRVGSHWDMIILALLTWTAAIVVVAVWGPNTLAARRGLGDAR